MIEDDFKENILKMAQIFYNYAIFIIITTFYGLIDAFFYVDLTFSLIITILIMIIEISFQIGIIKQINLMKPIVIHDQFDNFVQRFKSAFVFTLVGSILGIILSFALFDYMIIWVEDEGWNYSQWFRAYLPDIISGPFKSIGYIMAVRAWDSMDKYIDFNRKIFSPKASRKVSDGIEKLKGLQVLILIDFWLGLGMSVIPYIFFEVEIFGIILLIGILVLNLMGYLQFAIGLKELGSENYVPEVNENKSSYNNPSYKISPLPDNANPLPYNANPLPYNANPPPNPQNLEQSGFKTQIKFCPRCGTHRDEGTNFCKSCGYNFNSVS